MWNSNPSRIQLRSSRPITRPVHGPICRVLVKNQPSPQRILILRFGTHGYRGFHGMGRRGRVEDEDRRREDAAVRHGRLCLRPMGRGAGVMLQGQGTRPERAETAAAAAEAGGWRRPNPLKMKAEKLFWIGNRRRN
jgi:hypothetical protein